MATQSKRKPVSLPSQKRKAKYLAVDIVFEHLSSRADEYLKSMDWSNGAKPDESYIRSITWDPKTLWSCLFVCKDWCNLITNRSNKCMTIQYTPDYFNSPWFDKHNELYTDLPTNPNEQKDDEDSEDETISWETVKILQNPSIGKLFLIPRYEGPSDTFELRLDLSHLDYGHFARCIYLVGLPDIFITTQGDAYKSLRLDGIHTMPSQQNSNTEVEIHGNFKFQKCYFQGNEFKEAVYHCGCAKIYSIVIGDYGLCECQDYVRLSVENNELEFNY